jgi:hypothetical protein
VSMCPLGSVMEFPVQTRSGGSASTATVDAILSVLKSDGRRRD